MTTPREVLRNVLKLDLDIHSFEFGDGQLRINFDLGTDYYVVAEWEAMVAKENGELVPCTDASAPVSMSTWDFEIYLNGSDSADEPVYSYNGSDLAFSHILAEATQHFGNIANLLGVLAQQARGPMAER